MKSAGMAKLVMAGLVPGIHDLTRVAARKTWIAGTSPATTENEIGGISGQTP
jgi:hypothetical protein